VVRDCGGSCRGATGLQRRCIVVCVESDGGCDSKEVTRCEVRSSMLPRCGTVLFTARRSSTTPRGERISTSAVFVDQQCSINVQAA
jgi:hypothetical protein